MKDKLTSGRLKFLAFLLLAMMLVMIMAPVALAAEGGEANLKLPDLSTVNFLGISGQTLLTLGLIIVVMGLLFGLVIYTQIKKLPAHKSMKDISELIYQTCKAYMVQQGKFLMILWVFIGIIIAFYFGVTQSFSALKVIVILLFSVVGMAGSYGSRASRTRAVPSP